MSKFIFTLFFLFGIPSFAQVWITTTSWNEQHEVQYSNWVKENWTQDIFTKGILKDLSTDCADATYTMRALFSFQHQLPFQISGKNNSIWGQDTKEFDFIADPENRFRAFLQKMYDLTNTTTLGHDTFPVALDRSWFRPGIIYVEPGEHSYQIVDLTPQGVPVLLNSTTPKMNRVLFQTLSFPFYRPESKDFSDGYRAFRWPEEMGIDVRSLSRANFKQYSIPGNVLEYAETARKQLALEDESLSMRIDRELTNICYFARERAYLVVQAHLARLDSPSQCLVGHQQNEYSTPLRDQRLKEYFMSLRSLRNDSRWSELDLKHRKILLSIFVEGVDSSEDEQKICQVSLGIPRPQFIELFQIWKSIQKQTLLNNPNLSILARWGLEPAKSICP